MAKIEGWGLIIREGTVWERIDMAIESYQERFGCDPYEIHIDARLNPPKIKGIYPLEQCLEGQIILVHEPGFKPVYRFKDPMSS